MAQAFNLTAQLNLQGPSNLKTTVARIRRELGSVSGDIKININASSIKSIDSATAKLKSLNDALIQSKGNVDSLSRSFSSLSNNITSLGSGAKQVSTSAASIATNSSSAAKNIKQTSDAIEDFGKKSALAVKRFAAFSIVTTGIYALTNSITSGLKAFISFDRELIKLQQVTGKGAAGISSLEKEITRLATSLGVSSESLLSVASTLAQAGLSADQTRIALGALAKTELAPSFDNLTDTTEGAIAALKQFGLQAQDLEAVLGSINAVAAAFAVESRDIIAAIQRTGGVFASASKGVTEGKDALNEFIAVFTSVRATTRESAETIATGLRTIFTRIQRAKTIDLLKEYGVVLTDLEGKFVGPFEAVKRLSAALNQIDPRDIRFSSIIEELGGFRQIGKVIPLIQQFATAQEALRVAQKGQSSLTDAQVKAQQSLANQIAKVREQFLALIRDVGKSAVFQGLFKVVTSLASGLISLASAFKPILPILAIFGAIKGIGAVGKFATGFVGSFAKGGGSRDFGETVGGTITGNSERDRAEATKRASQHIAENTTAIQSLTSSVNTLDKTLNTWAAVVRTLLAGGGGKTLNQGGKVLAFARGGIVPGSGNRDTVPAMLQPGEFVIRKNAVNTIGADKLHSMNKYANGGIAKENSAGMIVGDLINGQNPDTATVINGSQGIKIRDVLSATPGLPPLGNKSLYDITPKSINKDEAIKILSSFAGWQSRNYSTRAEGVTATQYNTFRNALDIEIAEAIKRSGQRLASSMEVSNYTEPTFSQEFSNSLPKSLLGNMFEYIVDLFNDQPIGASADNRRPFDYIDGVKPIGSMFANMAGIKYVDAKVSPGNKNSNIASSEFYKKINNQLALDLYNDYQEAISQQQKKSIGGYLKTFASGGSTQDTVPALLTPGEFVINKRAAKKIGSAKLHRLNKADKLEGYNKGGAVGYIQKLADGGDVEDIKKRAQEINTQKKQITERSKQLDIKREAAVNAGNTKEAEILLEEMKALAKEFAVLEGEFTNLGQKLREINKTSSPRKDSPLPAPPVSMLSPERKAAIRAEAAAPFQEQYKAAPTGFRSPEMGIQSKEDIKNLAIAKAETAILQETLSQVKLNKEQKAEINDIFSKILDKYSEQYDAATTVAEQEQVTAQLVAEQAKAARDYIEAGVGAGTVQERVDFSFGREAPKTVSDVGAVTFDAKKMATQKADREAFFEYKARKQGVSVEDYKYGLAQQLGQKAVAVADPGMYKGRAQEMGFELAGKQETLTGIGATISKASAAVKANPKDAAAQTQLADAQSRLAQEAEKIAAGMMALNPTLDMDKTSKAASEVAALLSEGRLSEAQAKLIESLGKAPEGVDAMNIAMEQLAKEAGVSADLLKAEFAAGTKGGKQAKQQQFIASREGQRFGMFAELAPDLAQRISGSKFGGALGKGADFVSGKGGKYSRAFSKLGGFSGIGGGIAVGAEALKNVLPTSVTSNPNVAGALGGLTGAGTGAATGAQLGSLAGPIGTLIGGVGGAIIGGIKGFFDAKNQAILTNALDNLSKSTSDLDEAFKKLDQDASNTNLQAAQKAFGKVIEAQQRVGNINSPEARAAMIQSAGSNVQTAQRLSEVTLNKQTTQQIGDTLNEIKNGTAAIGPTAKAYEDAMIAAEGGMGALSDKEKESIRTRAKEQAALDAYIQKRKQSGASDEQIEAAISKNRKRAIAEGAASVKIADEAGLKQELLARATKEVAVASENLLDVYRRIGASLQRFSDEVDRSIAGIQGSIGDLTGNAQVQKVDRTNEQILGNISAYSMEEVRGAAQVSAGMMGGGAQAGGLVDTAVTAKVLQDQLPALLRQTEGRNVGDVMDILEEQITSATGQSSEAVKQVLQQARTTLESQATSEQGTSFAELAGSDITQKISDTVQEGLKVAVNVQKTYNDTLDKTIDLQNQYNKTIAQAREYNRKATSIRLNAELDLAKALGKNISLEALNKPFETEIKSLTQGLVGGGGTTDPAAIAAAISQKQQENKTLEQKRIEAQGQIGAIGAQGGGDAQQAAAAAATQTIYGLNDSMAKNKLAIDEGRSALEKLANDGSAAANALSKIQEQQQKVEGIGNFIDKLATADPAELFQINKQGAALELALSGRAGNMFKRRSFRQDAYAGLEQEREMLTSEEYKTAKAKIKEQELRAAGFKEGDMITTKSGTQIEFTDLIKRLTEGPGEEDPQVKAYREATERQAQAAEQLGKLSNDAATILKDEIGSIFEKLKTDFPNIVTKAFADARADAAALLAGQEGKKPEAAAKPGRDVSAIETDIAAEQKKVSEIDAEIKAREKDVRVASKTIKENQGFFGSGIQLSMAQKQKKEAEKKIKDLREQRAQASANVDQLNQEKEDTTKAQEQAVAQQTEQQTAKPATTVQQAAAAFTPGSMMQQMMGPGLTPAMQQQMVGTLGTTLSPAAFREMAQHAPQLLSNYRPTQTPAIQEVANAATTSANIPALAQAFTTMTPGGGNGLAGIVNSVAPVAGPLATQMNMGYNNQTNAGGAQGAAAPAAPVTAESLKAFSDTLSTVFNGFGSYVEQLAGIKLPEKIEMVGNHVVDVRVTGAAAFEALQDGIKELINSEIDNKMSQIWSQTGGALGSRPGSSGRPRKPPTRGSEGYG